METPTTESTTENTTESTDNITITQIKDKQRTEKAIQLILNNPKMTTTQIAAELGLGRTQLHNILKKQYPQEIMQRELNEIETTLQDWIQQLWQSESPTDRRTAATLLERTASKLRDKLQPSLLRTENINANLDLQKYEHHLQTLTEAINQLPPTIKQQIWTNVTKIEEQNKSTT